MFFMFQRHGFSLIHSNTPAYSWLSLNLQEILDFLGNVSVAGDKNPTKINNETKGTCSSESSERCGACGDDIIYTTMSMTLLA
jgi:hypothetical protein